MIGARASNFFPRPSGETLTHVPCSPGPERVTIRVAKAAPRTGLALVPTLPADLPFPYIITYVCPSVCRRPLPSVAPWRGSGSTRRVAGQYGWPARQYPRFFDYIDEEIFTYRASPQWRGGLLIAPVMSRLREGFTRLSGGTGPRCIERWQNARLLQQVNTAPCGSNALWCRVRCEQEAASRQSHALCGGWLMSVLLGLLQREDLHSWLCS